MKCFAALALQHFTGKTFLMVLFDRTISNTKPIQGRKLTVDVRLLWVGSRHSARIAEIRDLGSAYGQKRTFMSVIWKYDCAVANEDRTSANPHIRNLVAA